MGANKQLFGEMREQDNFRLIDSIERTITNYEDGNISVLDSIIELRLIKSKCDEALKFIKEFEQEKLSNIEDSIQDYPEGYKGVKFKINAGRKTFDFKHIQEWKDAEKLKKEIEARSKSAFESSQKNIVVATEDGEEIELPNVKYSASSLTVTFPK